MVTFRSLSISTRLSNSAYTIAVAVDGIGSLNLSSSRTEPFILDQKSVHRDSPGAWVVWCTWGNHVFPMGILKLLISLLRMESLECYSPCHVVWVEYCGTDFHFGWGMSLSCRLHRFGDKVLGWRCRRAVILWVVVLLSAVVKKGYYLPCGEILSGIFDFSAEGSSKHKYRYLVKCSFHHVLYEQSWEVLSGIFTFSAEGSSKHKYRYVIQWNVHFTMHFMNSAG